MNPTCSLPSIADHSCTPAQQTEADGAPTWITRSSHLVLALTQAQTGTRLNSLGTPDEHMVLLPETGAVVRCAGTTMEVPAGSLLIVPPGDCELQTTGSGVVLRAFTVRQRELAQRAGNAADFADARPGVAPLIDWPAPPRGLRLRVYALNEALADGDKTRVFRSSNLMINILRERTQARDVTAMSPHSHTDFEQASVTLSGVHMHHLRYPWTPNMHEWRPDEAVAVGAPSVTVIPPGVIHTTRNVGSGPALLVDVFAPPRMDFSLRPGMVRNADEYPLPETRR